MKIFAILLLAPICLLAYQPTLRFIYLVARLGARLTNEGSTFYETPTSTALPTRA